MTQEFARLEFNDGQSMNEYAHLDDFHITTLVFHHFGHVFVRIPVSKLKHRPIEYPGVIVECKYISLSSRTIGFNLDYVRSLTDVDPKDHLLSLLSLGFNVAWGDTSGELYIQCACKKQIIPPNYAYSMYNSVAYTFDLACSVKSVVGDSDVLKAKVTDNRNQNKETTFPYTRIVLEDSKRPTRAGRRVIRMKKRSQHFLNNTWRGVSEQNIALEMLHEMDIAIRNMERKHHDR